MICKPVHGRFSLLPWGGVSLVEIMVAMGLTSVLLLTDMQRHDNNQKATLKRSLLESASDIPTKVRAWLRNPNVISYSFGSKGNVALAGGATFHGKRPIPLLQASPVGYRQVPEPMSTPYNILGFLTRNSLEAPSSSDLEDQTNNMLIGPPNSDNSDISSSGMDGTGRVYIRAMWVESFNSYFTGYDVNQAPTPTATATPGTPPPDNWKRGTASLKAVVWRFTSRPTSPSLTCGDGCTQSTFDIPLDIRVGNDNKIIDGSFGLKCGEKFDVNVITDACSSPNEFFDMLEAKDHRQTKDPQ